jgi:hypothetical protein
MTFQTHSISDYLFFFCLYYLNILHYSLFYFPNIYLLFDERERERKMNKERQRGRENYKKSMHTFIMLFDNWMK